jgi:hypothetical protein
MTMQRKRFWSAILASAALAATNIVFGQAAVVPPCDVHLSVELTPDVPNPRDLAFLSSLLSAPGFQLIWRQQNDSAIELELTGPGPDDACQAVIESMRKDARVQSITVHT